jgi:hypothetical protein
MNKAAAVALFVVAALLGASCAAPRMKLPSLTAGSPAVDATAELTEASRVCRQVSTMTAEIGVKGSISHQRIRVRLLAGLQAPSSAYLEAVAPFGAALFTLTMAANDATVVLPRENRVLRHGAPSAVLEALTGVPLDAADLKTTLTGCTSAPATGARSVDAKWIVLPDTSGSGGTRQDVYLTRPAKGGPWQIAAVAHHDAVHGDWHAEYSDVLDGLPRTIRLIAADDRFDLTLSLTQLETNVTLRDDTFTPRIPPSAAPITIEELRDASGIADSSTRDD